MRYERGVLLAGRVLIQPALGALDARFDWSALPGQTLWIGVALMIPCTALIAWVLGINRHAPFV